MRPRSQSKFSPNQANRPSAPGPQQQAQRPASPFLPPEWPFSSAWTSSQAACMPYVKRPAASFLFPLMQGQRTTQPVQPSTQLHASYNSPTWPRFSTLTCHILALNPCTSYNPIQPHHTFQSSSGFSTLVKQPRRGCHHFLFRQFGVGRMVRVNVLNDALQSMYNVEKKEKVRSWFRRQSMGWPYQGRG